MIRKLRKTEIDDIADIWLDTNLTAHSFISAQYWRNHFNMVKELFLQAEIYVYENEKGIQGFVGLEGEYIAGIFVRGQAQCQGIGKCLLNFVKDRKERLRLHVYQKNMRAIRFYQREAFEIQCESLDEDTGEKEFVMIWQRK